MLHDKIPKSFLLEHIKCHVFYKSPSIQLHVQLYLFPILLDFSILVLLGLSSEMRWYHHILCFKSVISAFLGLASVCELWNRGLTGKDLMGCEGLLEAQLNFVSKVGIVGSYLLLFLANNKPVPKWLQFVMVPLTCIYVAHAAIASGATFQTVWPFFYFPFAYLFLTMCVGCCRVACCPNDEVATNDPDSSTNKAYSVEAQVGFIFLRSGAMSSQIFGLAAIAGLSYYGFLVDSKNYNDSLRFLYDSRPPLIGWVVTQYQEIANWL